MKWFLTMALALVASYGWTSEPEQVETSNPQQVIHAAASELLGKLEHFKDGEDHNAKVNELVQQIILPIVDQKQTARLALGRHWKEASAEQRENFIKGFRRLLIDTYASAFIALKGQKVEMEYEGTKFNKSGKKAIVRSRIKVPAGSNVLVDYRLYLKGDEWKVYDASVEGLGIVKTYRTQFGEQIKKEGLDKAIETLLISKAS